MTLRCLVDGLMLPAELCEARGGLVAYDGDESFTLEAMEASYYELVEASSEELFKLEGGRRYRMLRRANDFECVA